MAVDWTKVIGSKTIDNGGYVGDLLEVATVHIDKVVNSGRLTKDAAGQVYASMVQNAIQTGVKFAIDQEALRLGLIPSTLSKG